MENTYLLTDFYCRTSATDKSIVVEGKNPSEALKEFLPGKKYIGFTGKKKADVILFSVNVLSGRKMAKRKFSLIMDNVIFFKVKEAE